MGNTFLFERIYLYLQCVFHSIRFKVNKVGIQRYPIFFALLSTRKRPPRKTITSTKQTFYLWRNSHTPPPNHPKEEREKNTHCANMQRKPEAKHCSSLCSQSEGDEDCGKAESTTCANRASNYPVSKKILQNELVSQILFVLLAYHPELYYLCNAKLLRCLQKISDYIRIKKTLLL